MIYGLLAIALILSLPACGMFRKSEQPVPEATEQMGEMPVEEVDVTEEVMVPAEEMVGDQGE